MGIDKDKNRRTTAAELRRRAEVTLRGQAAEHHPPLTKDEMQRLVHELEVFQVELAMQNAELRQARDEMEKALDNYVDLYNFAPIGYLTLDRNGAIKEVNARGAGLLGFECARLIGRTFGLFLKEEDRPAFTAFLDAIFTNSGKQQCELAILNKGGLPRIVQAEATARASGDECRVAVIDITESKRLEEEIRVAHEEILRKQKFLHAVLTALPVAVCITDEKGGILLANDMDKTIWGERPVTKGVGDYTAYKAWWVDTGKALAPEEWASSRAIHQGEIVVGQILEIERFDGTHRFINNSAAPVHDENGRIIGSAVAIDDITELLQAKSEIIKAKDTLELKVSERTGELNSSNQKLIEEIAERKRAETLLQAAYAEIVRLKDQLQEENLFLREEVAQEYQFSEVIGHSDAISYVFFRVEQVAPQDVTVLLLGETGTGKGLIARAIHSRSARKDRPMVTVNCTSLPANLIESELFGREKGAFTGAHARQMGRFELADGGTIFLDEIGEMPLELQSKLLRVIQDGEFERLGSPHTIKVNVRIIAASNRDLEEEIRAGRFRQDLFYRLNVFPITIPPLRQRTDDIPLLIHHFVAKYNKRIGRKIETVSKQTLNVLQNYHWPGNVRELENVIERAVITSQGSTLQVLDRFETFHQAEESAEPGRKALAELERDHILQVLQQTGWRIEGEKGAAILLGLNPSTLRARMRKSGIRRQ